MAFNEFLIGKREQLVWKTEATYGTGVTPDEQVGINARMEPNFNQNWQEVLSAGTNARTVESRVVGPLSLPFTLTFAPVTWEFLKYCGYACTDAGAPGAYTHTFAIENTVRSFTLEWARRATTSRVITLTGCVVKKCTIAFRKATGEGTEALINVTLECVAQNYSLGTSVTTVSAITLTPFQFRMVKWTINTTETVEVNSGDIAIDNGINEDDVRYCNSTLDRKIGEPIPKVHRINGALNVNIKDATQITLWDGAAAISGTNTLLFYRGSNDQLLMTFTGLRYAQCNEPTNLDGVTASDIAWTALSFTSMVATDAQQYYT